MGWRAQVKSTLGQADDEEKETAGTELKGGKGGRGKAKPRQRGQNGQCVTLGQEAPAAF